MKLSRLAESIQASPLLAFAAEVNRRISKGEKLYNLTIGDFDPNIFKIPSELKRHIVAAYQDDHTNYPGAFGVPELRQSVADLLNQTCGVEYHADDVQIASGSRPLIYAAYRVLVDEGEKVVYPVPSWNNDHYTQMIGAQAVQVQTSPENDFMPTADELAEHVKDASLLALCSPQNPTGTVFTRDCLGEICELVVAENKRRGSDQKPLYVMFDQVYWLLIFGNSEFFHPLKLCPALYDYAVFIDGLSKSLAGTGVRVGWGTANKEIMSRMCSVIAHIGAWAPKPEQVGAGRYLADIDNVKSYLNYFRVEVSSRLEGFYQGVMQLKQAGYPVDAIEPQAAIYLTVRLDLIGSVTKDNEILNSDQKVHRYILDEAGIGILPFSWFGASTHGDWFRLSVGTSRMEDIDEIISSLQQAIDKLKT